MNRTTFFIALILSAAGFAAHAQTPGTAFRDCDVCPEMVAIPAGSYTMGSPESQAGRDDNEGPRHEVTLARAFAAGKFEVTRGQFAAFVAETSYDSQGDNCYYWSANEGKWVNDDPLKSWRNPGFTQAHDEHPLVCVSWNDAKAYVAWLARKSGKAYRLLSEAEWEYAARAGSTTARAWGNNSSQACTHANVGDVSFTRMVPPPSRRQWTVSSFHDCDDGAGYTVRVGSYRANAFGLYDMIGNVWEWTEDCWNATYSGAPVDGSAWLSGECSRRVDRGGGWSSSPRDAHSALRYWVSAAARNASLGFRVARTL